MTASDAPLGTPAVSGTLARWAWVGIALVIAGGLALRFGDSGPLGPDSRWYDAVVAEHGSAAIAIAVLMAQLGGGIGSAACTAILVALLLAMRRGRDAVILASAMIAGVVIAQALELTVLRPRPSDGLYPTFGSSYPSGHTMGAAAFAISLAWIVRAALPRVPRTVVWSTAICWIMLMAWSRTALHAHWLSDTLAGAVLGISVAVAARRLWTRPRVHGHRSTT